MRLLDYEIRAGGPRYDHCGNCNTQCFDRDCRGERVVRIFAPRVLIAFQGRRETASSHVPLVTERSRGLRYVGGGRHRLAGRLP